MAIPPRVTVSLPMDARLQTRMGRGLQSLFTWSTLSGVAARGYFVIDEDDAVPD
jgi:hypothetical protein